MLLLGGLLEKYSISWNFQKKKKKNDDLAVIRQFFVNKKLQV